MAFKFADLEKKDESTTMIVDALNLAFRWKHTSNKCNNFKYDFEHTVKSLANSYKAANIIITADKGSSSYRKALYPEYKADRAEKFKDQTEADRLKFEEFFAEYEATLELLAEQFIVLRYQGVEADDIAAHLVLHRNKYNLDNIWLISSDRDWDLLVTQGVSRFSYKTRKETTISNWSEHYDVSQEEYVSLKCLMGDSGDNVKGIKDIGPKRAKDLITQYGSALAVYDAVPIDSHYAYMKNLNNEAEQILINYELMDLLSFCDTAIGQENIKNIKEIMNV
jgi:DNA polymerase-1